MKQAFVATIDELDLIANTQTSHRVDAYFALATFNDKSSRKVENAHSIRSFFLDIDCGPGKPYPWPSSAAEALRTFIDSTGLPVPYIVGSGGGLHVYWPIIEDLSIAEWQPLARALKALCASEGLFADPSVTTDAARILRVPGTTNFKEAKNDRPVVIVQQGQAVSLEEFASHLPTLAMDLSAAKQFGMDAASRELATGDYPVCNFRRIVIKSVKDEGAGCNQIKKAVVEAATLEEPLWRAALSIAIRCEDGAQAIHHLSKAHPGYSPHATEQKAGDTKGPHTCQWYKDNYPAGCKGCKHNISSPIMLGRIVAAAPATAEGYHVEMEVEQAAMGEAAVSKVKVLVDIPEYPFPYFRGINGGVYKRIRNPDGDDTEEEIYRNDLYIVRRFFDSDEQGDGDGETALIQLHMDKDGIRQFYSPVATLFTKDKMRDLLIKNGVVAYGKQLDSIMAYFASSIRKLQAEFSANRTRSQMGWTPDMLGFVVGEIEYTPNGAKLAPPASGTRQLAPAFTPRGSLAEWSKVANFYNRPGLEAHALALFFGFGSPLLKLVGGTAVKGLLVHLKSNKSGSGKTTVQTVVNSIFGHPTETLLTKDDTTASKIHMLGMLNSICPTIDEVTNMSDAEMSDICYGVTTGRGRHRMDAQTNKMRTNHTTWCNITISSANSSFVDRLGQYKATAEGELKRVFEIEVPKQDGVSKVEIDAVFSLLEKNYGVAGPVYIQYVMNHREEVANKILTMQRKFDEVLGFDQSDRFHSTGLACAFVGASICIKLGLFSIDTGRVFKFVSGVVERSKTATIASTGSPLLIAQETLSNFINENIRNVMVIRSPIRGAVPMAPEVEPKGPLKMRYEPDTKKLFITVAEFRKFFAGKQVDVQESTRLLSEAGIMLNDGHSEVKRIGAGAVGSMSGLGVRCFVIDGDAIGVDEQSFKNKAEEDAAS